MIIKYFKANSMVRPCLTFIVIIIFLSPNQVKSQTPLSTNALRAIINEKLVPVGTGQVTAPKLKEVANSLVDQIGFKADLTELMSVSANVNTRTTLISMTDLRASHLSTLVAPVAVNIIDPGRAGLFLLDLTDMATPDNKATVLRTSSNLCYKRVIEGWGVNVKWFGAKGDGLTDDKAAIQAAVDWAKTQKSPNGGNIRINVIFPNGSYRLNGTGGINITNANGIWLSGGDGKYLTTQINGNCSSAIFDFTGSTMSGCSGFTFVSNKSETSPASIGVIFALSQDTKGKQLGGLNCSIRDCYFQLDNNPSFNGGFGTVGILNIRSEEFKITDCLIRANTGIILSSSNIVKTRSSNYTFKSNYANIAFKEQGSMGVVDIAGTSIQNYEKLQHALVLNGTNGVNYSGYLHGCDGNNGSEDSAIGLYQSNLTLNLSGTIEGFSTLMYLGPAAKLYNSQIKYSYANIADISKPVIFMEANSLISHSTIGIVFGNGTAEMGHRFFLYTPPINQGISPTTASISQSNFNLPDWYDNTKVISTALLKQTTGICQFNTGQPFTVDSYWITDNKKYPKSLGTLGNKNPYTILRFLAADKPASTNKNGGIYVIKINGTIRVGDYTSIGTCVINFTSTLTITQDGTGRKSASPATTIINSKSQTLPSYADITNIITDIVFDNTNGNIRITTNTTGTGTGEPITFLGSVSILTDFFVNSSPIFE
jgi:hypothetical protein